MGTPLKPANAIPVLGMNNRRPAHDLQVAGANGRRAGAYVRDAVNVDLSDGGSPRSRQGQTRVAALSQCRSLFEVNDSLAYLAAGDKLLRFDGTATTEVATVASAFAEIGYAVTPLGVVWSDGFSTNLIGPNGQSRPLVPPKPNPAPSVAAAAGGSLAAGRYAVSFAAEDGQGLRSAMTDPVEVVVGAAGRLEISAAASTYDLAVFVTARDGSMFYRAGTLAAGATTLVLPLLPGDGEPVAWVPTEALPASRRLAYARGRLLSLLGNFVLHSLPWALGLYRPASDFLAFPTPVTLVAPTEAGVFFATAERTWFLGGRDIRQGDLTEVAPYGAIEGTLTAVPNSKELMWFTPRGPVVAGSDGALKLLQDDRMSFGTADIGAAVFRETNGLRQYVTSLGQQTPPAGAAFGFTFHTELVQ